MPFRQRPLIDAANVSCSIFFVLAVFVAAARVSMTLLMTKLSVSIT